MKNFLYFLLICTVITLVACNKTIYLSEQDIQATETSPVNAIFSTKSPNLDSLTAPSQTPEMTSKEEIQDGINLGNKLIETIKIYYQENNEYPPSLENLIPQYIKLVPVTATGQVFEYVLLEPNNYWGQPYLLIFHLKTAKNVSCSYMQRLEDWDCSIDASEH